ncbi:hypothetical protein BJ165DRAFT_1357464 [Panaeolus papilionaceus]|nr:hypothetical protein BJ165DRAFT_1357464 [Panaeolus papilionaceus]
MSRIRGLVSLAIASLCANAVYGHVAAFHKGMYCINGPQTAVDLNSYAIVYPLYQMNFRDWWSRSNLNTQCMDYPPADGDYIDLPAGGTFSVEIGSNRAKTSLSYGGRDMSDWPDGQTYPEDYVSRDENCIIHPNLHTQDRQRAAGTVFAISYESDIRKVTPENLVVFTVRDKTPWKRVIVYDVPAAMPACPAGGCICAWGWVPDGCGQPNMYHQAFKCRVSGATSTTPVGTPKPPVWCENDDSKCVKGPKQMVYWNQNERNNVFVSGWDSRGLQKSPTYNRRMGFYDGKKPLSWFIYDVTYPGL